MTTLETLDYADGSLALQGWLLEGDDGIGPVPGILVFPEFMGLGTYLVRHLEHLAGLGYVVLAADMYGKAIRPETAEAASMSCRPLRADRTAMRRRALAAFDRMRQLGHVDAQRIAAVGFSFGGCAALELARTGAPLKGAASFYGYLDTTLPAVAGTITAKLLVFHGMHDPIVPVSSLADYCQEMDAAGADSRVVTYADAGHGFCNREMDGTKNSWNRYSRRHDQQSWQTLKAFLAEVLAG